MAPESSSYPDTESEAAEAALVKLDQDQGSELIARGQGNITTEMGGQEPPE